MSLKDRTGGRKTTNREKAEECPALASAQEVFGDTRPVEIFDAGFVT